MMCYRGTRISRVCTAARLISESNLWLRLPVELVLVPVWLLGNQGFFKVRLTRAVQHFTRLPANMFYFYQAHYCAYIHNTIFFYLLLNFTRAWRVFTRANLHLHLFLCSDNLLICRGPSLIHKLCIFLIYSNILIEWHS